MGLKDTQKEEFTRLVMEGYTIPQLMVKYNCSRTSIATAKRNWNLVGKTPNSQKINAVDGTKHCFKCDTTKSLSEFYSNGKTPLGTQKYKPSCIKCESSIRRTTLTDNLFRLLTELKMEYKCKDCGLEGPYGLLDFHHREPKLKLFSVGIASTSTYSYETFKEKMEEEILKCDILCPTCHRYRHIL